MELFQILDGDGCGGIAAVVKLIKHGVLPLIQIGIPILLILMGSIDLGKAVLSSDDKEIKGATGKLVKRAIAAVAVFFVGLLVSVIMGWLGDTGDAEIEDNSVHWGTCWDNV